ncbi:MAG: ribonuclease P protein component [Candidatus Promineifilaceae bacterium]
MQRRYRLQRPADFEQLRKHGRRWHHPLALLIVHQTNLPISRFAFSAGKRVGKAVVRNRAKRLLREAVRHQLTVISSGWDCLFVVRPATVQATYAEVEEAVVQLLIRANVIDHKEKGVE